MRSRGSDMYFATAAITLGKTVQISGPLPRRYGHTNAPDNEQLFTSATLQMSPVEPVWMRGRTMFIGIYCSY
jgi:hypothetical protein